MSRRVTWSILLLLLTSIQSFAVACNTRCALMAMPAKAATMNSGMEHCNSMPSASSHIESTPSIQALQTSSGTTCCNDLSFAKDPGTTEQTDSALHALADASINESVISFAPIQKHERPPAHSSTIPPFKRNTLASNLRI